MLKMSDFAVDKTTVIPKPLENRSAVPASKRPPYTRLSFEIVAHGDLISIVDFLDRFYRLPLLHRIRNLRITRPLTVAPGQMQLELDFTVTVEALIVDGAEKRDTLLPKGVTVPPRSVRTSSQYASIAGRDIFFGPPAPSGASSMQVREEFDEREFVVL